MKDRELIDEIKKYLPIPAHVSRDLSKYLILNGKSITPEMELEIIEVV